MTLATFTLAFKALGPLAVIAAALASVLAQFEFPTVFGTNMVLAAAVVGFFMPPLIDAINRRGWSSEVKAISAFLLCVPGAALSVYLSGQWNRSTFDEGLRSFLIVLFVAIAMHRFYWKPSGISDAIDKATG
jgi:hypothetical protein